MKTFVSVTVLLVLLQGSVGLVVKNPEDTKDELIAVAVLYRDGDKTPTLSFPNDPFFDPTYWPMGFGELTENGKLRQYQLGEWLRTRYDGFLPEEYSSKDIYVFSTDTDRTLASALVNLAGLYPPNGDQLWNKNILWQPIPVHTIPTNQDQVLYMERPCPRYNQLYEEVYNSTFFQDINEKYADFYAEVSELTGWQINDVSYLYKLQQVLNVYANYDETLLPGWYDSLDLDKLNYLAGLDFARYTFTDELKKLGDGPFFNDLFSKLDKVLDESQEAPKFLVYSGHESTIGSVLNGMGVFDYIPPQFASSVIWEIRKNEGGGLYVNLFYRKDSTSLLDQLKLPKCDLNCEYGTFKSILSPFTLDLKSWDIACLESK